MSANRPADKPVETPPDETPVEPNPPKPIQPSDPTDPGHVDPPGKSGG